MSIKWEDWEIELLKTYMNQSTTIAIVAKLLSKPKDEVEKKIKELKNER